jgi:hypothetical protein
MPFIIINAEGNVVRAPDGSRLEFNSRRMVKALLLQGERIERIPALTGEELVARADLARESS